MDLEQLRRRRLKTSTVEAAEVKVEVLSSEKVIGGCGS
jgi:hypothetical protein